MSKFLATKTYRMIDENGNIIISFVVDKMSKNSALMLNEEMKNISSMDVEVKKHKSNRSLEQNKMLWSLLSKMATAVSGVGRQSTAEECYCEMLEEANVKYDFILALPEAEKMLKKSVRVMRKVGEREVNGKMLNMYQYFIGSSKFNTKEMTELIDAVLDRLAELGIYDSEIAYCRENNK